MLVPTRAQQKAAMERALDAANDLISEQASHIARLEARLNTPETRDFASAVVLEAAHQLERWGSDHDAGKTDADWLWLIGYLAGKALHNPGTTPEDALDKKLHRIITIAAAAANWHAQVLGKSNVRPGIVPPESEVSR